MAVSRIVVVGLLVLAAACSKVTPDNYERVESGMSRDEVHAILGKPDDVSGGGVGRMTLMTERWNGREHVISVTFSSDKVMLKRIEPRGES
ncbi:MAG: outer membrane protein assembly factor BamE domain-containing protein [Sinimarinibacterium flocculans]|uniref:Beta-barrel assembly machine subunit BamE n=1 Tax=Sinimarinibacterium flocculans TaxID=985250 RepID=A0A318EK39_9GAMM|nr:outer membrane protein assembly factor BamE [Sinimarinibacterium flocculans]PXV71445.1 Beta-barrel assembly machine subunit BamE [Sinimarinibacterium flocculans]